MPTSLLNSISEIKNLGYKYKFVFHGGKLINSITKTPYRRHEFVVDKEIIIEGTSDHLDTSILFAITCHDGVKGYFSNVDDT